MLSHAVPGAANGDHRSEYGSELGIVAVCVTLLMISGNFDLSVGAIVGFSGYGALYASAQGIRPRSRPCSACCAAYYRTHQWSARGHDPAAFVHRHHGHDACDQEYPERTGPGRADQTSNTN